MATSYVIYKYGNSKIVVKKKFNSFAYKKVVDTSLKTNLWMSKKASISLIHFAINSLKYNLYGLSMVIQLL